MAFFNDFKELFQNAAQSVSNKTKDNMEINRLSSESRSAANEISTLYEQIGKTYVDTQGCEPEALAPLCARVVELRERLEELDRQKMRLRNQNRCPACGAVMGKNARFCSNCGRRLPEPAPETETAPIAEDEIYCPECGAMRKGNESYCAVCGSSYQPDAAQPQKEPKASSAAAPAAPEAEDSSDEAPTDYE